MSMIDVTEMEADFEKLPPHSNRKKLIVCIHLLREWRPLLLSLTLSHQHIVLQCNNSNKSCQSQKSKYLPFFPWIYELAKGKSKPETRHKPIKHSGPHSQIYLPTCDWQEGHHDLTVHHSNNWHMLRGLTKSPGHPLCRYFHLALFNPLHPITWQRRTCAHHTLQQRSFALLCKCPYNISTVISVPSPSPGWRLTEPDVKWSRRIWRAMKSHWLQQSAAWLTFSILPFCAETETAGAEQSAGMISDQRNEKAKFKGFNFTYIYIVL